MNFDELESAVLALPEKDRKALANRLWESVELSGIDEIVRESDLREFREDAAPDGWTNADEFMETLKRRA